MALDAISWISVCGGSGIPGVSNARGSAIIRSTGGKLRFWDSKEKRNEVRLPQWLEDVELPHTVELWMEATDVSAGYEDQTLTLSWQSARGNTGAEVRAYTTTSSVDTYARLSLQFGDCPSAKPSFGVKLVEPRLVRVYVVPLIEKSFDSPEGLSEEERLTVQRVFANTGISFAFVQQPGHVFAKVRLISRRNSATWSGLSLASSLTDGLIVYVSPYRISDASGFTSQVGGQEIFLSSSRRAETLAHEIGHAFGLRDIYTRFSKSPMWSGGPDQAVTEKTCSAYFQEVIDWNSGSGERYYLIDTKHAELISRLLMNGSGVGVVRRDIPHSAVYGAVYMRGGFSLRMNDVGHENITIPEHYIIQTQFGGAR